MNVSEKTKIEYVDNYLKVYDADEDPMWRTKIVCPVCGAWQTYGTPPYCMYCGKLIAPHKLPSEDSMKYRKLDLEALQTELARRQNEQRAD